ncbi:vWA domain-containing protein [Roseovarius pelagicus]|uniref:VWA domain-containing protein n=1 Tax=Roseovarius pelagicus TaxID=2980108 RepID=A0ABY6DDU4_9RHOB|nr:VWA domain-containing protein [Roseovarius pelagicus]UXX84278.1 VWA domain-containing protein [Roseovarius pelagicus]
MTATLPETDGRLAQNIVHFARALRKAGVNVGTAQVHVAVEAVERAGFTKRQDFYHTLRACLVTRPEHLETYHQVFAFFWRDPDYLERMMKMMLPLVQAMGGEDEARPKPAERRAAEALSEAQARQPQAPDREEVEVDASFSWSEDEKFRQLDFEQMSAAEIRQASRMMRTLRLPVDPMLTRRCTPSGYGRIPDTRRMLRRAMRRGGEMHTMSFKQPRKRPPDLVALCDISGSMSVYSRMMMHFLHALTWAPNPGWGHVHGFTFGTQLTNVTRALHLRDVDLALQAAGQDAPDWQGGTRIGEAFLQFNRDWSRRVLGQGAAVLLITDGLERGDTALLETQVERLARSCRKLIWLNPLLRWDGFAPKAAGIRAILPHVGSFHACHSLDAMSDLAHALDGPGEKPRLMRAMCD